MASDRTDTDVVLEFIRSSLNTFAKWDVATYFHNNPFASDSAKNIARFAGRDEAEVAIALPALVADGILQSRPAGVQTIYRLTEDSATRVQVAEFVSACEDRDFRARAIQIVIERTAQS